MCLQDSQRKGRKSSWPQYSNSQRAPIASRSLSVSIWVKDCCWSPFPLGFWPEENERGGDIIAGSLSDCIEQRNEEQKWYQEQI